MTVLDLPPVSRETEERLRAHQNLLHKWQEKINLISPSTLPQSWCRHFEDSLQIATIIPNTAKTLYDLGCGAGFPGLVLAMRNPQLAVTLVESDAKKCAFLQTVSRETATKVTVLNKRIEAATQALPAPDIITARALASLSELFKYVWPWAEVSPALTLIFPKGENWAEEIEEAKRAGWTFSVADYASRTQKSARILVFTNLRKNSV